MTMNTLTTPADETVFGAFGDFLDTPDMTDEEWHAHDAAIAAEMAAWDAAQDWEADFTPEDGVEPPF